VLPGVRVHYSWMSAVVDYDLVMPEVKLSAFPHPASRADPGCGEVTVMSSAEACDPALYCRQIREASSSLYGFD
jgi:hypothetical protein